MGDPIDLPPELSDSVPQVVDLLNCGRMIVLSDGGRKAILANALSAPSAGGFAEHRNGDPGVLLLRDASTALDFMEDPSPVARRLMRRCWPGTVRLVFARGIDTQLLAQLPETIRGRVQSDRGLALGVPDSPILQRVLQRVPFPLVKANACEIARASPVDEFPSDSLAVQAEAEIQIDGHHWRVITPAGLTPDEVSLMTSERVLFVCTGNTCRSPIAEAMFRHLMAQRMGCAESELPQQGFAVASAGMSAVSGSPPSPESVEVCRPYGVDLSGHMSQPLTESLLRDSDHVFTMTAAHRDAIVSQYPQYEESVQLLCPAGTDVSDPMGWGMEAYQQCHQEITQSLQTLVEHLAANQ